MVMTIVMAIALSFFAGCMTGVILVILCMAADKREDDEPYEMHEDDGTA